MKNGYERHDVISYCRESSILDQLGRLQNWLDSNNLDTTYVSILNNTKLKAANKLGIKKSSGREKFVVQRSLVSNLDHLHIECIRYLWLPESADLLLHMTTAILHFILPAPTEEIKTSFYKVNSHAEVIKSTKSFSNYCKGAAKWFITIVVIFMIRQVIASY